MYHFDDGAPRASSLARALVATTISALVLGACSAGSPPSPSPTVGPSATASPSPSAAAFDLTVVPESFGGKIFSGSKVVLLVSVGGSASDGPVTISAATTEGTATVDPTQLEPGRVGEVTVMTPSCTSDCDEISAEVRIDAQRSSVQQSATRDMTIAAEASELEPEARTHLEPFITWLAANRPDLGITASTVWEGVPGTWVLIVEHYLFFSADWELDLSWHVMIAPDDWSEIDLRHRGSELAPSLAFKIDSVSANDAPHEIAPPEAVWR